MAVRKNKVQVQKTRDKIKATHILNRLMAFALGMDEPTRPGQKCEMSPSAVKAAQGLLNKVLPDLSESDVNLTQEMPENKAEVYDRLKDLLGEELALKIAPEFIPSDRTLN